jgi:hypothetical protein
MGAAGTTGPQGPAGPSNVYINRSSSASIPLVPVPVASMTLPAGDYLLSGKMTVSQGQTSTITCTLTSPAGDSSSNLIAPLAIPTSCCMTSLV